MDFTCHTTYDQKALTAMARAVRKKPQGPLLCLDHHWTSLGIPLDVVGECLANSTLLRGHRCAVADQLERGCPKRVFCKAQGPAWHRFCRYHILS